MLSGGERNRLLLARLFARPANILVLDEPTNDLDIESLELLEQTLQDYRGTLLLVSHDRTFLDNVVTQTLAPEGDGRWKEYVGGYSATGCGSVRPDVLARQDGRPRHGASDAAAPELAVDAGKKPAPAKLNYKETRELDQLPSRIEALEKEQRELARSDVRYVSTTSAAASRCARMPNARRRSRRELEAAFERWAELEAQSAER